MIRFLVFFFLFSAFAFVICCFYKWRYHHIMLCYAHYMAIVSWHCDVTVARCILQPPFHRTQLSDRCRVMPKKRVTTLRHTPPLPLHPASSTLRPTTLPDIWPPQPWTYAFPEQAIGRCVNWSNVTWSHGQHELSRHTLMMMIKKTTNDKHKCWKKKKKKKTPKTQSMTPRTVKLTDIRRFTVNDNRWFCQVCK